MADPATLAIVGMGASAAGSLTSAFGSLQSGDASAGMYAYQSGMAQQRAKIARENRDYALATGEKEAARYGMGAGQRMGTITARQGASGIDIGSASSVDVRKSQQLVTEIDLATIRNNAARKAYGYELEAWGGEEQAKMYTKAGEGAREAGKIGAMSSILGGISSVSSKWLQGSSAGLFGSRSESFGDPSYG